MIPKARVRRGFRAKGYSALDAAQEILDDALAAGFFEGQGEVETAAIAERVLGREFDDVDVRVEDGRLVARAGASYWNPGRRAADWLPEEAT